MEHLSSPDNRHGVDADSDLIALGNRMRELRKQAGLTQEELASRANLSANYIGEVERGERNPSLLTFLAVARALKVDASKLLVS